MFISFGFDLLGLSLDLGSSFVIVRQIASLAHTHRVEKTIVMLTFPSVLISSEFSVARWAHILSVMLSHGMRALSNHHDCGSLLLFILTRFFDDIRCWWFLNRFLIIFRNWTRSLMVATLGMLVWNSYLVCLRNLNLRDFNGFSWSTFRVFDEFFLNEVLKELGIELTAWLILVTAFLVSNKMRELAKNRQSKLFRALSLLCVRWLALGDSELTVVITIRPNSLSQRGNFLFVHVSSFGDFRFPGCVKIVNKLHFWLWHDLVAIAWAII